MNRWLRIRIPFALAVSILAGLLSILVSRLALAAETVVQPADEPASLPLDAPLRFERFSLEDGLSQNSVLSLLQDKGCPQQVQCPRCRREVLEVLILPTDPRWFG